MAQVQAIHLVSRKILYLSMAVVLLAIFVGAYRDAPPIYLAVGFIGEIILVSTAHLSSVFQHYVGGAAPQDGVGPSTAGR